MTGTAARGFSTFWTTLFAVLAVQLAGAALFVAITLHGQAVAVSSALHQTTQVSQFAHLAQR